MIIWKNLGLGAAFSALATAAMADTIASSGSAEGGNNMVLASMPVAPSIAFFVAGILGLAILARRRARKSKPLY